MGDATPERNLRIVLRYDGSAYFGWQRQNDLPSVQARVEAAVARVTGETVGVNGSGRTDAGVHALAQVANFTTRSRLPPHDLHRALNANLPLDIAIRSLEEVPISFHARYSARRKTYIYQLFVSPHREPFRVRHSLALQQMPDIDAMRAAAAGMIGEHDFRSFATAGHLREDTVRDLMALRIFARADGTVRVFATANGFLQHMVRTLVGGLLRVGTGRENADWMKQVLTAKDRKVAPAALPANGLFLWRVDY